MTVWSEVDAKSVFTAGAIEVVAARLDAPPVTVRALSVWLCDAEQRRAPGLRFGRDRRRFIGCARAPAPAARRTLLLAYVETQPTVAALAEIIDGLTSLAQPKTLGRDAGEREQFVL